MAGTPVEAFAIEKTSMSINGQLRFESIQMVMSANAYQIIAGRWGFTFGAHPRSILIE